MGRVTAVFGTHLQAEAAVNELRTQGATDKHIGVVARHDKGAIKDSTGEDIGETAADTAVGGLAGVGVGAIVGLVAAFIPGVGPFIAAGTIGATLGVTAGSAAAVAGGAAAVAGGAAGGAIVGGAIGSVLGALTKAGYEEAEAKFYARRIEEGGTLVAADDSKGLSEDAILTIFRNHGGHVYQE